MTAPAEHPIEDKGCPACGWRHVWSIPPQSLGQAETLQWVVRPPTAAAKPLPARCWAIASRRDGRLGGALYDLREQAETHLERMDKLYGYDCVVELAVVEEGGAPPRPAPSVPFKKG